MRGTAVSHTLRFLRISTNIFKPLVAGTFVKLVPLAHKYNARIVLVNRRDYPGATPYTEEELTPLREANVAKDPSTAHALFMPYLKERARELHTFLVHFVVENDIPSVDGNTGGIVLAGWSLGSIWMTALLAHVHTFPVVDVELGAYMRRIVLHGMLTSPCSHMCCPHS